MCVLLFLFNKYTNYMFVKFYNSFQSNKNKVYLKTTKQVIGLNSKFILEELEKCKGDDKKKTNNVKEKT